MRCDPPTPHVDSLVAAYALDAVDADERRLESRSTCANANRAVRRARGFLQAAVHLTDGRDEASPC